MKAKVDIMPDCVIVTAEDGRYLNLEVTPECCDQFDAAANIFDIQCSISDYFDDAIDADCVEEILDKIRPFVTSCSRQGLNEEDKKKLFDALDKLYDIMSDAVKPRDKDAWKQKTWEKFFGKTKEELYIYISTTLDILS